MYHLQTATPIICIYFAFLHQHTQFILISKTKLMYCLLHNYREKMLGTQGIGRKFQEPRVQGEMLGTQGTERKCQKPRVQGENARNPGYRVKMPGTQGIGRKYQELRVKGENARNIGYWEKILGTKDIGRKCQGIFFSQNFNYFYKSVITALLCRKIGNYKCQQLTIIVGYKIDFGLL